MISDEGFPLFRSSPCPCPFPCPFPFPCPCPCFGPRMLTNILGPRSLYSTIWRVAGGKKAPAGMWESISDVVLTRHTYIKFLRFSSRVYNSPAAAETTRIREPGFFYTLINFADIQRPPLSLHQSAKLVDDTDASSSTAAPLASPLFPVPKSAISSKYSSVVGRPVSPPHPPHTPLSSTTPTPTPTPTPTLTQVRPPKKKGDIFSIFPSLKGNASSASLLPPRFASVKAKLLEYATPEKLQASWDRLLAELDNAVADVAEKGSAVVPTVGFKQLRDAGENGDFLDEVRKRGVVIVKGGN